MQSRIGLAPQIVVGVQENLEKTGEVLFTERIGGALQARALVGRSGNQIGIGAAHARDEQIAEMPDGFAAEMLQVLSFGQQPVHERENAIGRSRFDRAGQFIQNFFGDDSEQFADLRRR